jgi:hypothetical protein
VYTELLSHFGLSFADSKEELFKIIQLRNINKKGSFNMKCFLLTLGQQCKRTQQSADIRKM